MSDPRDTKVYTELMRAKETIAVDNQIIENLLIKIKLLESQVRALEKALEKEVRK